ncbi:hypothetical protein PSTG_17753, partial [Puccinia striiformis f. sp. tritici PST-78]
QCNHHSVRTGSSSAPGLHQLRTYLTRANLTSSRNSAWTAMKSARSDWAYVTTMGIDVATFDNLLDRFEPLWNTITLPRNNVNPDGHPKCARQSLDAAGCLGLVLHWLCSTIAGYLLQQIFGITPAISIAAWIVCFKFSRTTPKLA